MTFNANDGITVASAKQRYANARRRARYWSGTPSYNPLAYRTGQRDLQYELAMCDCLAWECRLRELTGKPMPHYDPRAAFARSYRKSVGIALTRKGQ